MHAGKSTALSLSFESAIVQCVVRGPFPAISSKETRQAPHGVDRSVRGYRPLIVKNAHGRSIVAGAFFKLSVNSAIAGKEKSPWPKTTVRSLHRGCGLRAAR